MWQFLLLSQCIQKSTADDASPRGKYNLPHIRTFQSDALLIIYLTVTWYFTRFGFIQKHKQSSVCL